MLSACRQTVNVAKQGRLRTTSINASLSFLQHYQDVLQLGGQAKTSAQQPRLVSC